MQENLTSLNEKMGDNWHWKFIKDRINHMWSNWVQAAHSLCKEKLKCTRDNKKVKTG